MATVTLSPAAARDLEGLPAPIHARVIAILDRLGAWPEVSGAKPLRGELAGSYRIRTGDYRVQFRVRATWFEWRRSDIGTGSTRIDGWTRPRR